MGCSNSKKYDYKMILEHFQPAVFPIKPIISPDTQSILKSSWQKITHTSYDNHQGSTYFYNKFYEQLFIRYQDFELMFPNIKERAHILGRVVALCISINFDELDNYITRIKYLGKIHQQIVPHPYMFSIYAVNLHNTIKICLLGDATVEIMNAWLHTLAWILKIMIPEYMKKFGNNFDGIHDGAVNAYTSLLPRHIEFKDPIRKEVSKEAENILTKRYSKTFSHTNRDNDLLTPSSGGKKPFILNQIVPPDDDNRLPGTPEKKLENTPEKKISSHDCKN